MATVTLKTTDKAQLTCDYSYTQSIANNTSSVTLSMYIQTMGSYGIGPWADSRGSYLGATTDTFNGSIEYITWHTPRQLLRTITKTVNHAQDGTGNFTAYWKWGTVSAWGGYDNESGSFAVPLATIPRASSITRASSSVVTGSNQVFTISRASTSFTHTIQYSIGSSGWQNVATGVATSHTWTVPHALIDQITNAASGTVSIRVLTYSGTSHIGTSSTITFTITIPASSVSRNYSSRPIGQSVTFTASRVNTKLTHTMRWKLSNTSNVNINTGIATTQAWTLPTTMIANISNAASATITVQCLTYNGTAYIGVTSTTLTGTIPTSTLTFNTAAINVGSAKTITIDRIHTNLTHNLRYRVNTGTWSGNFATAVATSYSWTTPTSIANSLPSTTSGTITVESTTRNGTATVGTHTRNFTINIPNTAAYQPEISTNTVSRSGTTPAGFSAGTYIKGKHAIAAVMTTKANGGATVSSNQITIDGVVYSGTSKTSPLINKTGNVNTVFTVTDSRNRSKSITVGRTFTDYFNPSITTFTAERNAGNEATLDVDVNFAIAAVLNENAKAYIIEYKKVSDYSWTTLQSGNLYTLNTTVSGASVLGPDDSYDVRLSLTDSYNTTPVIRTTSVGTAFTLMNFNESGKGMAIGKVSESDTFEVALPTDFSEMPTVAGSPMQSDVTWANVLNKPTTFPPSTHTHNYFGNTPQSWLNGSDGLPRMYFGNSTSTNGVLLRAAATTGTLQFRNSANSVVFAVSATGALTAGTVPWARLTSVPSTFTPSAHNHSAANITSGALVVARGGTGRSTLTNNTVLVGNGTTAISMLSRSGIDSRATFPPSTHTHARSQTSLRGATNIASGGNYSLSSAITNFDMIVIAYCTVYSNTTTFNGDYHVIYPHTTQNTATGAWSGGYSSTSRWVNWNFTTTTNLRCAGLSNTISPRIRSVVGIRFTA